MIKPPVLLRGDKVAAVTLSWGGAGTFKARYEFGKKQLVDRFGLDVVELPHTLSDADYVYQNPSARAQDLMEAFKDPSIKAIFSCIGGSDSIRLLPYVDLDVIRQNPKIFMGYSDTTVTHFMCYAAGLISFYGPAIMAGIPENGIGMFPYTERSLQKTLFESNPVGELLPNCEGWSAKHLPWEDASSFSVSRNLTPSKKPLCLQGKGKAAGHLIGGCLEVLDMLKGTSIWPSLEKWRGAVFFIETSEDAPSLDYVTYALRNYGATGILGSISALLVGRAGGAGLTEKALEEYNEKLSHTVVSVLKEYNLSDLPVLANLDFGHTDPMFVLPMGIRAEVDCESAKLSLVESATALRAKPHSLGL